MRGEPIESELEGGPGAETAGGGVRLGKLQLAIMRVLWRRGEAAVTDVHEDLAPERGLAPTTVATMLAKLERKGVVSHRTEGRRFIYRPLVDEQQVRRSMVGELTSQLFAGDVTALVNHLLSEPSIEARELAELRALIRARERELGRSAGGDDQPPARLEEAPERREQAPERPERLPARREQPSARPEGPAERREETR